MNKIIILLFLTTSINNQVWGQLQIDMNNFVSHKLILDKDIKIDGIKTQQKTSEAKERVVAKVKYYADGSSYYMFDSTVFSWSNNRSSYQEGTTVTINDFDISEQKFVFLLHPTKLLKTYNADGLIINKLYTVWNPIYNIWEDERQTIYSYTDKKLTKEQNLILNKTTSLLENASCYNYEYKDDKLIEESFQLWDEINWENISRTLYTLNGDSVKISNSQVWDKKLSAWHIVDIIKEEFATHDSTLIEKISSKWNAFSSSWDYQHKESRLFKSGLVIEENYQEWVVADKSWRTDVLISNSYLKDKLSEITYYYQILGKLNAFSKLSNFYIGDNIENTTIQVWSTSAARWENESRELFNYNINGHITSCLKEKWIDNSWQPLESDMFDSKTLYYYQEFSLDSKSLINSVNEVKIYPNPSTVSSVNLDFSTNNNICTKIIITNLLGQKMREYNVSGSIGDHSLYIPINEFSSGMYIVQIKQEDLLVHSLKFIKS